MRDLMKIDLPFGGKFVLLGERKLLTLPSSDSYGNLRKKLGYPLTKEYAGVEILPNTRSLLIIYSR
jgi:hypothetical protein